ncbi:hypothetical protein J7K03_01185 [bacterium]|nr:hypothetical protein [bacterium]
MDFYFVLTNLWLVIKNWWWLPLPFLLYPRFLFFWRFYKMEQYDSGVKKIILEVKIPREVEKPIKAMEQVIAGFHGVHDVFTWRETWLQGEFQYSIALEIASLEGEIHFFIRAPAAFRSVIESNIYSQYPDAEISLAEDYTNFVPYDIPNEEWDLFGFDFVATKEDPYPIKTYKYFEEMKETKEQKRLDPLAGLLEGMASIGQGEYMWLQIIIKPIREEIPWQKRGKELVDKLVHREKKPSSLPSIFKEAADLLISGKPPGKAPSEKKEVEVIPPEMKLTPGEREIVKAIEEKIGKFGFVTNIRCLYIAKRDVFLKAKSRMFYGFFKNVSTENLNGLKPWTRTLPKVQWFLKKMRTYAKQRAIFLRYKRRFSPLFPEPGGTFVLTTDEIATLYHFPGRMVAPAPTLPRIEAKKKEAPPGLPTE